MNDDIVMKYLAEFQNLITETIEHNVINFVDNSNSMLASQINNTYPNIFKHTCIC